MEGEPRPRRGLPPPEDCVFGEMISLPANMLPLNCYVGKALALKKFQNKDKNKGLSEVYLFEELAEEIMNIYEKASVPTYSKIEEERTYN